MRSESHLQSGLRLLQRGLELLFLHLDLLFGFLELVDALASIGQLVRELSDLLCKTVHSYTDGST